MYAEQINHKVFIAFGSNQGDRLGNMAAAAEQLTPIVSAGSLRSSHVYETRPIGPTGESAFLNAVVACQTAWSPLDLLQLMQDVEVALGRCSPREGPRSIDLDMLFFDDFVITNDRLQLPHPRLHERDFVLQPMVDLDEDFCHPVSGHSMADLLDDLPGPTSLIGVFAPGIPGLEST